jgi:hypothetical protein
VPPRAPKLRQGPNEAASARSTADAVAGAACQSRPRHGALFKQLQPFLIGHRDPVNSIPQLNCIQVRSPARGTLDTRLSTAFSPHRPSDPSTLHSNTPTSHFIEASLVFETAQDFHSSRFTVPCPPTCRPLPAAVLCETSRCVHLVRKSRFRNIRRANLLAAAHANRPACWCLRISCPRQCYDLVSNCPRDMAEPSSRAQRLTRPPPGTLSSSAPRIPPSKTEPSGS